MEYKDDTILAIADTIATVLASLLPILSTIVLYFIRNLIVRLGVIGAFIALFALVLVCWIIIAPIIIGLVRAPVDCV